MTWPSTERRLALRPARAEAACVLWSALRALALVEVALAYSQPERLETRQARMLRASMEVEQAPLEAAQPALPQPERLQRVLVQLRRVQAREQMRPEPALREAAQPVLPQLARASSRLARRQRVLVRLQRAEARAQALSLTELLPQAVAVASGSLPAAAG